MFDGNSQNMQCVDFSLFFSLTMTIVVFSVYKFIYPNYSYILSFSHISDIAHFFFKYLDIDTFHIEEKLLIILTRKKHLLFSYTCSLDVYTWLFQIFV